MDTSEIQQLRVERDRYKQLAQGALVNNALASAFQAARAAFLDALAQLPADEIAALEAQIGMGIGDAVAAGANFNFEGSVLIFKATAKAT